MPVEQNPTAKGDRVSWNSLAGASTKPFSPSPQTLQLPPIIARHLGWPDELGVTPASCRKTQHPAFSGGPGHD